MNETIKRATSLYAKGFITKDELASIIAREYAQLWARGQILELISR